MYEKNIKPEKYKNLLNKLEKKEITMKELNLDLSLDLLNDFKNYKHNWKYQPINPKPDKLRELKNISRNDSKYSIIEKDVYLDPEVKEFLNDKTHKLHKNHSIYNGYKFLYNNLKNYPEYVDIFILDMQNFEKLFLGRVATFK